MIFQSLVNLYDRLEPTGDVPPYGFSIEDIGFVITIDKNGNLVGQPEDLRAKIGANSYTFMESVVPYSNQVNVRSGNAATTPNFMVDKADYIFGLSGNSDKETYRQSFKQLIHDVCRDSDDDGVLATIRFLEKWNPKDTVSLDCWKEICGPHGKMVALRLAGETGFIHTRPVVKQLWFEYVKGKPFQKGTNFVDGRICDLQPQYAQFSFGTGASLVSFNEKAYKSYGKQGGDNAPISVEAEFKSSAALKYLFRNKTQRLRIGDATTLFWAERATPMEAVFGHVLNPSQLDGGAIEDVQVFLKTVRKGGLPTDIAADGEINFHIIGLSLNKARLALRFWYVCTISELMDHLQDHFKCLEMECGEKDIQYPGIWHLLKETARETKDISPVLGGALARSILTGSHYPQNLYQGVMGRIRADHRINYIRASIIKAVLTRNNNKEVPMSWDPDRKEMPYLLGGLFAVLEKAQLDALGKVNATIKDRFFSAASATPASVFPRLLRLSQHHIEKADYGHMSERRIAELMEHVNSFPAHMNLQDQGLFAIAYYHMKNAIRREIEKAVIKKNEEGDK